MEIGVVNTFADYIKNYDCIISECELVLDEYMPCIMATPDQLSRACIKIKRPYSIKYILKQMNRTMTIYVKMRMQ